MVGGVVIPMADVFDINVYRIKKGKNKGKIYEILICYKATVAKYRGGGGAELDFRLLNGGFCKGITEEGKALQGKEGYIENEWYFDNELRITFYAEDK